jgi:hypothetical protein
MPLGLRRKSGYRQLIRFRQLAGRCRSGYGKPIRRIGKLPPFVHSMDKPQVAELDAIEEIFHID